LDGGMKLMRHVLLVLKKTGGKNNDVYIAFKQTEDGKLEPENGKYSEEEKGRLKVKFEKEVRLCLGCAIVEDSNGNRKGKRAKPFVYSGKVLLTIKDWNKNIAGEIKRVNKSLQPNAFWVNNHPRKEGEIFQNLMR
jgi:hypothetical protein